MKSMIEIQISYLNRFKADDKCERLALRAQVIKRINPLMKLINNIFSKEKKIIFTDICNYKNYTYIPHSLIRIRIIVNAVHLYDTFTSATEGIFLSSFQP